jgi:hypothetical protein
LATHPMDYNTGKFINGEQLIKDSKNQLLDLDLNLNVLTGSIVNELAEYQNSKGLVYSNNECSISPFYLSISMILVSKNW